ncbi:hypothetical protein M409DRAFT_51361 [Zasmidium cellare ATCC 36951]|uniref:Uncharacterized protein n=1 Tax=Zasmidium cellare ATCC 36951 TaxID=1080233 RepID=A0A6A6CVK8_ZASCE|nr:uncharacterized protein M409DRAFT_51361 [Zasmidium cellare ATCC 36951]KAF2171151.1 hypothetical protein M409DRAFT_51361 [Zasmidium cellare ATCC 36951]
MNTIRSVGYGWGVLIIAGGGSYYFAKRSINADREQRALDEERRRQQRERLRVQEAVSRDMRMGQSGGRDPDASRPPVSDRPSPSREAAEDPAPVTHAEGNESRGKYEAAEPFRSRKGDRFS